MPPLKQQCRQPDQQAGEQQQHRKEQATDIRQAAESVGTSAEFLARIRLVSILLAHARLLQILVHG